MASSCSTESTWTSPTRSKESRPALADAVAPIRSISLMKTLKTEAVLGLDDDGDW